MVQLMHQEQRRKRWTRIPLKVFVVISLCIFTLAPALALWLTSWKAGHDGLHELVDLGRTSLEDVSDQLRDSLIDNAQNSIETLINGAENLMNVTICAVEASKLLKGPGANLSFSVAEAALRPFLIAHMRQSPWMESQAISLLKRTEGETFLSESFLYARLGYNYLTSRVAETLYYTTKRITNLTTPNISALSFIYVDQTTGESFFALSTIPDPTRIYQYNFSGLPASTSTNARQSMCSWRGEISFNVYLGIPMLIVTCVLPTADHEGAVNVVMDTNSYTVSSMLRTVLSGENERLFLFFRNPMGYLVGASHGKYYSHSDIDYSKNNPTKNPLPPVKDFQLYTALNATDTIVRAAGEWMWSKFGGWDTVPEFNDVIQIPCPLNNGGLEPFWIVSQQLTSSFGLQLQLVLLVDRQSKMGHIESQWSDTLSSILLTNERLIILLCVVMAVVLGFALTVSIFITRSLNRLVQGMDHLALLELDGLPQLGIEFSPSRFSEVFKCEISFLSLERGLRAFIKYVPRDVVKMMLNGEMQSENTMNRRVLTILFMDIAGFSGLSENLSPDALVKMMSDYLQAMCELILKNHGVLDKFVGDCIMAMWNAPVRVDEHAVAACHAAIEMQHRLLALCRVWEDESLPDLRFRVGINTDRVLVGNYGCDYRINFTCLGDGVNLASRLESTNKHFDTVVLVAENCKSMAEQVFRFRKIGDVVVPGKVEVSAVYELLYAKPETVIQPVGSGVVAGGTRTSLSPTTAPGCPSPASMEHLVSRIGSATVEISAEPFNSFSGAIGGYSPPGVELVLFHWNMVSRSAVEDLIEIYEKGMEQYVMGNLDAAERLFQDGRMVVPNDGACKLMMELCRRGRIEQERRGNNEENGDGLGGETSTCGWDGVIRFDKK